MCVIIRLKAFFLTVCFLVPTPNASQQSNQARNNVPAPCAYTIKRCTNSKLWKCTPLLKFAHQDVSLKKPEKVIQVYVWICPNTQVTIFTFIDGRDRKNSIVFLWYLGLNLKVLSQWNFNKLGASTGIAGGSLTRQAINPHWQPPGYSRSSIDHT